MQTTFFASSSTPSTSPCAVRGVPWRCERCQNAPHSTVSGVSDATGIFAADRAGRKSVERERVGLLNNLGAQGLRESIRNIGPIVARIRSVSFSLYGEDLLLHHMQPQRQGFYVDVGAFHPRTLSNTYKLYLRGWRGITIEPNPQVAEVFKKIRPRDTHLTVGIAAESSTLTYYKFKDSAQNTFDSARAANLHDTEAVEKVPVPCLPLNDVFQRYCRDQPVDLISVDCEGRDFEVVQSLDWSRYRPTVVIVEDFEQFGNGATAPDAGAIRSFFLDRDYALASQAIFSFFYVDRHAFSRTDRNTGFRLDQSQLGLLAL